MSESSKWIEIFTAIGAVLTALFTGLYWRLVKKRGDPKFSLEIDQIQGNRLNGRIIIENPGPVMLRTVGFKADKPKGLLIALPHTGSSFDPGKGEYIGPTQVKSVTIDYALNVPPHESKSVSLVMDLPSNTRRASLVSVLVLSMASNRFLLVRQIKNAAKATLPPPIAKKAEL
jgi:hypothetical protein